MKFIELTSIEQRRFTLCVDDIVAIEGGSEFVETSQYVPRSPFWAKLIGPGGKFVDDFIFVPCCVIRLRNGTVHRAVESYENVRDLLLKQ